MAGIRDRLGLWLGTTRGLGVLAFLAAVLVWYGVRAATGNSLVIKDIPVDVLTAEGMQAGRGRVVDVVFLGSRDDLRVLYRDAIKVTLDLRGRTNTETVLVHEKLLRVDAPGSARVEGIHPSTFEVRLTVAPVAPVMGAAK